MRGMIVALSVALGTVLVAGSVGYFVLSSELAESEDRVTELSQQVDRLENNLAEAEQYGEQCEEAAVAFKEGASLFAGEVQKMLLLFPYYEMDLTGATDSARVGNSTGCDV